MATEEKLILEMQSILQKKMEKDYQKGKTKRDAHPKCLGLLKANFKILEGIPNDFNIGVFKPGHVYKSFIRVSNSSGKIQSDAEKDFRGFAIKLLDVNGERFNTFESNTQDFVLMSQPTMPLGTVKLFRDAVYYNIKLNGFILALKLILTGKFKILKTIKKGKINHTSPLDIPYWSTTPYTYGDKKVKYKIIPTSTIKSTLPKKLTNDYLTMNMDKHLKEHKANFDFFVQCFKDETTTPIENAGVEWKEIDSPFIKLAEIEIPTQKIYTGKRFQVAEQLSFSPANTLKAHQPIGGLNRARIKIYEAISKFRHQRNNKQICEPTLDYFEKVK